FAGFELGDPHPYQVAADAMPLGQAIERLASREFLTDLTLERDRMDAMLGRWAVFFKGPGTPG
ncbi:MAG TPA: hypothetical protein VKJ65_08340, partial [Phycisphaerae bacterium]|nr:hypothetical protein [Phycisphaerae bacterium]